MVERRLEENAQPETLSGEWRSLVNDWSADREAFPKVSWNKTMMWIFLLSDVFVFTLLLVGYMAVRLTTQEAWPDTGEVFALTIMGHDFPLLLIAIMTFILITSSGTMAMAVNFGYRRNRKMAALFLLFTVLLGASFVGMQAYEWTDLIQKGVRPWENPMGAPQFGAVFFMITGFHGLHVSIGVIYLLTVAIKVLKGDYDRRGNYEPVEVAGLYWHFVDLVWVFIFAFFYLL
ncbi:heme-copper oxidase subunit III family protein [Aquisalimonas sp.]|uniref:heme-copper oxidase subunit III family protein n=1 Tax=Aquisalimonas sp. TaxID=1872621 RepID=UPI0025C3AA16|nr:heme-copper oxidase subunit III family protein [Aquisalimonas sp.]